MSGHPPSRLRSLHFSPEVQQEINEAKKKYARLEDALRGWKWRLEHQPGIGYKMRGVNPKGYYLLRTPRTASNCPAMTFLYTFSDNEIIVHELRIIEDDRTQETES